jgi:hypothetical protein
LGRGHGQQYSGVVQALQVVPDERDLDVIILA